MAIFIRIIPYPVIIPGIPTGSQATNPYDVRGVILHSSDPPVETMRWIAFLPPAIRSEIETYARKGDYQPDQPTRERVLLLDISRKRLTLSVWQPQASPSQGASEPGCLRYAFRHPAMDGRTRIPVYGPDARQHKPAKCTRPSHVRACQLHVCFELLRVALPGDPKFVIRDS